MVDFKRALAESRAKRLREEYGAEIDRVLKELDKEIELLTDKMPNGATDWAYWAIHDEKLIKLLKDAHHLLILTFK